ncbi:MAG: exodeoxyribonuclease V subunit gamma [Candidatus Neptunochlamydia sp.]|nr:exodeoxyribonuclease V subunit gamma [Candidatus Neptunochlamydia sp.]
MHKKPIVTLSNSVETLVHLLGERLFLKKGNPFEKKIVLLPDLSLKHSLMTSFVSDEKLDVVLGIDFIELGSGLQTLFKLCAKKKLLFPPFDLLTLQLEALIDTPGLAPKLAIEFLKYGKYGGPFLKKWREDSWQKKLWDQVFSKWNYPYQLLETSLKKPSQRIEIHLFNFPFLPKLYHLFFERLAQYFPIYYYQFSPCQEFWSDTVTDYEKMHLLEKDKQLSLYLDQGHPILSNLGKMGRESFRILEEEDFTFDEHYVSTACSSYLSYLQSDILNFKHTKPKKDASLLLLPVPTKLREVEVLYTKLLQLNIKPSDIQIFAPDISSYAPLIELVFKSEESPFDFTIYDLPESPVFQAFFDLLSLDRFKTVDVFKLFSSPYFASLSEKETKLFKSWIDQSGVKWGVDRTHRKDLLPNIIDETESGTWKEAFDALLANLIFIPRKPTDWDLPYLDFSDAETLGKGITLIEYIRADLDFLKSAHLSGEEWADHLLVLFNRYFNAEEENFISFQEKILLLKEVEGSFSFSNIKRYLMNCLKQKRGVRTTKNLESLTFRSLRPGAISSSKIIGLLGMHEGAYPRPYVPSSLNLLGKESDYCPTPPDEDRYLFLQVLMSAQENILITYQNLSDEDGKERPPSILIQELDPKVETHPPFPFHHHYFSSSKTYPLRHYEAAQAYYKGKEKLPFIPEYLYAKPLPKPQVKETITLQDLARFAKNPIRLYFNHILNLYLHYKDNTDEEFFLSPLQKYKLLQAEASINQAGDRGKLPLGRFKEIAEKKIKKEWERIVPIETHPYSLKNFEGTLEIAEEGFPFLGTAKLYDLIKIYPLYLALCVENLMPLILLRENKRLELKREPQKALEDYLNYYFLAQETPSPLIPSFAEALLKKDVNVLASRIKNAPPDPYLTPIFASPETYDSQVIFDTWSPLLRKTFEPLLEMVK